MTRSLNAALARTEYARKSPMPTRNLSNGNVTTETTSSYLDCPTIFANVPNSMTSTSSEVNDSRNSTPIIVGREVPMRAPKREAEDNIRKFVFLCDKEPRYPFSDQLSPR